MTRVMLAAAMAAFAVVAHTARGWAAACDPGRPPSAGARPGATVAVQFETTFPEALDEGDYDLLLHLPDPERGLYGRPAYSIRLANAGLWEPDTGFNRLDTAVTVVPPPRDRVQECADDGRRRAGRRCAP